MQNVRIWEAIFNYGFCSVLKRARVDPWVRQGPMGPRVTSRH